MSKLGVSESEIIADIRRVARLFDYSPSSFEYIQLGRYNIRTLHRKFKVPWKEILKDAGLRNTPRTFRRILAQQQQLRTHREQTPEIGAALRKRLDTDISYEIYNIFTRRQVEQFT